MSNYVLDMRSRGHMDPKMAGQFRSIIDHTQERHYRECCSKPIEHKGETVEEALARGVKITKCDSGAPACKMKTSNGGTMN